MASNKAQEFKVKVISKIQNLLNDYAAGNLNREQFNVLYERYSSQLALAQQALETGNAAIVDHAQGGDPTYAIRQQHMGKAIGLAIYQNKTGISIETLGDFDVSAFTISPVLYDFSLLIEAGKFIDPRVEKLEDKRWLLFNSAHYTTVVTLFHNEPSPHQIREIVRLHHDFEVANKQPLHRGQLDSQNLAYPFIVFVQHKLKKP